MSSFARASDSKSIKLAGGVTYSYVHAKAWPGQANLLFLHGFPESSYDWHHQIRYFKSKGYGIVAPDLLGYGRTDKPKDVAAYRMKKMCEEVLGILDAEGIEQVIGVGHDWGSMLLSRMAAYFPHRFTGYAFVSVGYTAPQGRFDVDALNEMTEKMLGYPASGYFQFFDEPGAVELLERKPESTDSLFLGESKGHWAQHVCPLGGARAWLEAGTVGPLPDWLDEDTLSTRRRILADGGYQGPISWYRQALTTLNDEDESGLAEERRGIADQPVLLVADTGKESAVPGEFQKQSTEAACGNLRIKEVDAGHWMMLQKPAELNRELEAFFEELGGE